MGQISYRKQIHRMEHHIHTSTDLRSVADAGLLSRRAAVISEADYKIL
jgi:hypothetical protein